jgi:hypothetical protein
VLAAQPQSAGREGEGDLVHSAVAAPFPGPEVLLGPDAAALIGPGSIMRSRLHPASLPEQQLPGTPGPSGAHPGAVQARAIAMT